jgi:hypothetical protein
MYSRKTKKNIKRKLSKRHLSKKKKGGSAVENFGPGFGDNLYGDLTSEPIDELRSKLQILLKFNNLKQYMPIKHLFNSSEDIDKFMGAINDKNIDSFLSMLKDFKNNEPKDLEGLIKEIQYHTEKTEAAKKIQRGFRNRHKKKMENKTGPNNADAKYVYSVPQKEQAIIKFLNEIDDEGKKETIKKALEEINEEEGEIKDKIIKILTKAEIDIEDINDAIQPLAKELAPPIYETQKDPVENFLSKIGITDAEQTLKQSIQGIIDNEELDKEAKKKEIIKLINSQSPEIPITDNDALNDLVPDDLYAGFGGGSRKKRRKKKTKRKKNTFKKSVSQNNKKNI